MSQELSSCLKLSTNIYFTVMEGGLEPGNPNFWEEISPKTVVIIITPFWPASLSKLSQKWMFSDFETNL